MSDLFDECPDGTYIEFSDEYIDKIFKDFRLNEIFNKEE